MTREDFHENWGEAIVEFRQGEGLLDATKIINDYVAESDLNQCDHLRQVYQRIVDSAARKIEGFKLMEEIYGREYIEDQHTT